MGRLSRCTPLRRLAKSPIRRVARSTQGMSARPNNPDARCVATLLGLCCGRARLDSHDLEVKVSFNSQHLKPSFPSGYHSSTTCPHSQTHDIICQCQMQPTVCTTAYFCGGCLSHRHSKNCNRRPVGHSCPALRDQSGTGAVTNSK